MKLVLRSDYSFTMSVVGYQFPSLATVPYDSNWLNVKISVRHPDGDWTAMDQALLTYEVQELADWFRNLATGARGKRNMEFLEPCLRFDVELNQDSSEDLKVTLAHWFQPPWSKDLDDEFQLIFPLATIDLVKTAEACERELARYPQRTAH